MHDHDDFIHVYMKSEINVLYLITITNVKVTVLLKEQLCGYFCKIFFLSFRLGNFLGNWEKEDILDWEWGLYSALGNR